MKQIPELLLCVGAQKSGTTWLYNRLAEHAETREADYKELHYFSTAHNDALLGPQRKIHAMARLLERHPQQVMKYQRSIATGVKPMHKIHQAFRLMNDNWYTGNFVGRGRISMDFTPEYARLPVEGHDHIKRVSKTQKVIFLMREPVSRAMSAIRYSLKNQDRDITKESDEAILEVARKPVIFDLSNYGPTIETLETCYPVGDLRILLYEDVMNHKAEALDSICDWLQIDRLTLPESELEKRDNATESFSMPQVVIDELQERLAPTRSFIEDRFPQAKNAWANVTPV